MSREHLAVAMLAAILLQVSYLARGGNDFPFPTAHTAPPAQQRALLVLEMVGPGQYPPGGAAAYPASPMMEPSLAACRADLAAAEAALGSWRPALPNGRQAIWDGKEELLGGASRCVPLGGAP